MMIREYPKLVEGGFIRILNIESEMGRVRHDYFQELEDFCNSYLNPDVCKIPNSEYYDSCMLLSGCLNRIVQVTTLVDTREDGSQLAFICPKYLSRAYINTKTMEVELVAQSEVAECRQFFRGMSVTLTHSDGILYELNIDLNKGYGAYPVQNEASEEEKKAIFYDLGKEDFLVYLVEPLEKRVLLYSTRSRLRPVFVNPKFLIPT